MGAMNTRAKLLDRHGRPVVLVHLQKRAAIRKDYVAHLAWWRRPFIGYLVSIPLVAVALLAVIGGQRLLPSYFPGTYMFLPVLLVSLFWGVGPALFSVLLGAVALDYFYISPVGQFDFTNWHGVLQLVPFIAFGMIIAIITGQRELARVNALLAQQEAQEHAEELAEVNEQLEEANTLKDQFLSMASHELKTPITSIRGQAQVTLRRLSKQHDLTPEPDMTRTALTKIEEQTHRLAALVDDLLVLSSIRSGKTALQIGRCNLNEVCQGVVEDQRLITERSIELVLPETPIMLQADRDRLGQVIVNLVTNAIKYSPAGSPVQVSASRHEKVATVQVSDHGPGIPEEQQERIFETFYRVPNAQSTASNGFGLGLAICKDIVERHGGRIWCQSQPGQGSTFCVELPVK